MGDSCILDVPVTLSFNRVASRTFANRITALVAVDPFYRENLSPFPSYHGFDCWLAPEEKAGFAILPDRELVNVFSLLKKQGDNLVRFATSLYPELHLNCFGNDYLEKFYRNHGFDVYARQPNWNGQGPDVIYMRRSLQP